MPALCAVTCLSGETAFTLYDTYGFPLDLTQDARKSRGVEVDVAAFNVAMERQRVMARASWAGSGDAAKADAYWFRVYEKNMAPPNSLATTQETAKGSFRPSYVGARK